MFVLDLFDDEMDPKGQLPESSREKNPEPEQQQIDVNRDAALRREREPEGSEKIDAMLAQRHQEEELWKQTANSWLKTKSTKQYVGGPYKGKPAANAAYRELVQRAPELRGDIVITYYGPDEQRGVDEGEVLPFGRNELERWNNNVIRFYPEMAKKLRSYRDPSRPGIAILADPDTGVVYGEFNLTTKKGRVFDVDSSDDLAEGDLIAFERDPFERWKKSIAMVHPGVARNLTFLSKGTKVVAMDRFSRITYGEFDTETMKGRIFDASSNDFAEGKTGPGLWANIHAKRERIKHGSGERMRKPGSKGAPTAQNFKDAAKEDVAKVKEGYNSVENTITDIIEYLRSDKPGLDKESFLDWMYTYLDASKGKQVADHLMQHEDDPSYDEWYDLYTDLTEVSQERKDKYVSAASDSHGHADFMHRMSKDVPGQEKFSKEQERIANKRKEGLRRALGQKEEGVEEAYPGHIQKGKELDAATKKIQANLDRRIRGHELDAATKKIQANLDRRIRGHELDAATREIQKNLDKRIKKVDKGVAEGQTPEKEIERLKLRQNAEHGRASLKRQAATQARIRELEKQIKDKKGVAETSTPSDQPRIRKYSKIRADGSKAERFEVLDYQGRRASGQGPEGFDNVQAAKEFYYRNYDKLQAPVEESEYEGPRGKVTIDRSVPGRTVVRNVDPGQSFPTNIQGPKPVPKSKLGPAPIIPQDDHMKYDDEENMPDDPNYDPTKIKEAAGRRYWCKNEKRWKDVE